MPAGFLSVLSVDEVIARLGAEARLEGETVDAAAADDRVLARDLLAPEDLPQADRAGMDGYAVRAEDLFGAGESNPVWLDCVGSVEIDRPADFAVEPGQCASIVTGGHLPPGANAVLMVEYTRPFGDKVIEMRRAVAPGQYVMRQGEDARCGATALTTGTLLRPQELGLLAALGLTRVEVFRRPRVGVLSTGDELVPPGAPLRPGQIRDVNALSLTCLARRAGAETTPLGIVRDDPDALALALGSALHSHDVLFLSGGSSVGVRDFTVAALEGLEGRGKGRAEIFCHGVAISPGKPLILARVTCADGHICHVWGLPGQIASAQVVMQILGAPFLRHLAGHPAPFDQGRWPRVSARLARNVASRQGREDYIRVSLREDSATDLPQAVPVPGLSGLLRTLLAADGLVRIPASLEGLEAGAVVSVLLL